MKNQEAVRHFDRRSFLHFSGLGVLGGLTAKVFPLRTAQASPGIAHASWIHGHSVHVEYPSRIVSERRAGFYIEIEGKFGSQNWFHFDVPTPVIVNDNRLKVGSVMLRFKTQDAYVRHVHVYDGEKRIAEHNNVSHRDNTLLFQRFDVPGHPPVQWGLGISIGVSFGDQPRPHLIQFISAGCDFIT